MSTRVLINRLSSGKAISYRKDHKKELFWVWITYQFIKGMTFLTLIWILPWLVLKR